METVEERHTCLLHGCYGCLLFVGSCIQIRSVAQAATKGCVFMALDKSYPDNILRVTGLRKAFGSKRVLCGINLTIRAGDIIALVGPNGAGKSTTLRILAGLDAPDAGRIEFLGHEFNGRNQQLKREIGYVSDDPFLYEGLTGREFLSFIACVYRVERNAVFRLAGKFGLSPVLNSLISTYSFGMRHKLAFVAAVCHAPKLLLLDEPFLSFDDESREVARYICHEHAKHGRSILFATHERELARNMASRIVVLKGGIARELDGF